MRPPALQGFHQSNGRDAMATPDRPKQGASPAPDAGARERGSGSPADRAPAADAAASVDDAPDSADGRPKTDGRTNGATSGRAAQPISQELTAKSVGTRRSQFMISPRQVPGLKLLSTDTITQQLVNSPDIEIVRTVDPPRLLGLQSEGDTMNSFVCARLTLDKARLLQSQAGARVVVEMDEPLTFTLDPGPSGVVFADPGVVVPHAEGFEVTFQVNGVTGPLEAADVFLFGSVWPVQGTTDTSGRVTLTVTGETPDTIRALYVKPKLDHWSLWLPRPELVPDAVNPVQVKPISAQFRDFPDRQLTGWGQIAMGLDQVPASYDGAGVKVAIIDSGAAQLTHRNLHALGPGLSVVGPDRTAWTDDTIGHGSHCAGIIAGGPVGPAGVGVRGFAPAAEIHICRVFPGGRFSDLVSALDYCMEQGIDVVNMSLGGGEPSQIMEQRIIRAKQMGIACIVAAGNSGNAVQFPANTPHVLAVSAIGQWGQFPQDSYHATLAIDGFESQGGYFPAKFSCFGPEVDVCAPGVAIVSSLPADGFAPWDGTSMATPHVTGLAALVLAHHPDFKGEFAIRDQRRVERLFQIIKDTAQPIQFDDPQRTGAGLPSAPRALNLGQAVAAPAVGSLADPRSVEALRQLLALIGGSPSGAGATPSGQPQVAAQGLVNPSGPKVGNSFRTRPTTSQWFNAPTARGPAQTEPDAFAPLAFGGTLDRQLVSRIGPVPDAIRDILARTGLY